MVGWFDQFVQCTQVLFHRMDRSSQWHDWLLIAKGARFALLFASCGSISIDDKGGKFNTTSFITKAEMGSAPPSMPTKRRAVEQKPKRIKLEEVQPKLCGAEPRTPAAALLPHRSLML